MKRLPAWVGWPGTGPAPGHDWVPGPKLRFVILLLAYAFLALSLTVDYAASSTFFALALLGMYVGLRRGFVNGLTRAETLVMIAFAAYPAVAIISYLVGTQTNVGFRFLGRDLRFLLFVPIYLAVRWSQPRREHLGWALASGAVGALIMAIVQHRPWPAPIPQGVAGTHITFGDLALLSGFTSASFLWIQNGASLLKWRKFGSKSVGALAVTAGLTTAVLADSRGGWLAIPVLAAVLLLAAPFRIRLNYRKGMALIVFLMVTLGFSAWLIPSTRHRIARAYQNLVAYQTVANPQAINTPCVDRLGFLRVLMEKSHVRGPGKVGIARLSEKQRKAVSIHGCGGGFALVISDPAEGHRPAYLGLYRGNWVAGTTLQSAAVLARGNASFNVGWNAPWTQIGTADKWKQYSITKAFPSSDRTHRANIKVRPGDSVWVIPMQERPGAFAIPLAKTSVGYRLEMWRAALVLFRWHPWLGVGTGAFRTSSRTALRGSAVAPLVGGYEHAHSDYLTSLGTKGIMGLVVLLALLTAPVLAGLGAASIQEVRSIKGCVPMIACGFAAFGLTETIFVHSLAISWYVLMTAATACTWSALQPRPIHSVSASANAAKR